MQETPVWFPLLGRSSGEGIGYSLQYSWASLVAQLVKHLPAMRETWVQSLGWEDPLEKGKATHSSILAWRIPGTIQSMGVTFPGIWGERNKNWNCPSLGPLALESWCLRFVCFICIFILNSAVVSFSSLSDLGLMHSAASGLPDFVSLLQSHCMEGLPGGPVAKTLLSSAEGLEGLNPWSGKLGPTCLPATTHKHKTETIS